MGLRHHVLSFSRSLALSLSLYLFPTPFFFPPHSLSLSLSLSPSLSRARALTHTQTHYHTRAFSTRTHTHTHTHTHSLTHTHLYTHTNREREDWLRSVLCVCDIFTRIHRCVWISMNTRKKIHRSGRVSAAIGTVRVCSINVCADVCEYLWIHAKNIHIYSCRVLAAIGTV